VFLRLLSCYTHTVAPGHNNAGVARRPAQKGSLPKQMRVLMEFSGADRCRVATRTIGVSDCGDESVPEDTEFVVLLW